MSSMIKAPDGAFFKPKRVHPRRGANGFPIGPRTIRREKENAQLRKTVKTKHCELGPVLLEIYGFRGCTKRATNWAHSKKSRFLVTSRDYQEAAHSCLCCHDFVEPLGHKKMAAAVVAAIKRRPPQ